MWIAVSYLEFGLVSAMCEMQCIIYKFGLLWVVCKLQSYLQSGLMSGMRDRKDTVAYISNEILDIFWNWDNL